MPTTVIERTQLALESFLPIWLIVVFGLALLGLSWWVARRDARYVDKPRLVFVLLGFRCVAILILLCMLAGPTIVTTLDKLKTRSVALFVDVSASMGLVDMMDGSGNISRWAPEKGNAALKGARELDEALATLRAAQVQLERFGKIDASAKNNPLAREQLSRSVAGIKKGLDSWRDSVRSLPDAASETKSALLSAHASIENDILPTMRRQETDLRRGKSLAALDRARWLPQQIGLFSAALNQMEHLSDRQLRQVEVGADQKLKEQLTPELTRSRAEKVQAWLAASEQTWLKELRQQTLVTTYEFGDKLVPVGLAPEKTNAAARSLSATTELGLPLQQVALASSDRPLDAAILITDGGHNQGRDPRELAEALGATALHIVPVGNLRMQRDIVLHHTHAPKTVFLNDTVVIDSMITAYDCAQETLLVELLADDAVVDSQSITVGTEIFDGRVQLRWKAGLLGRRTFSLRVKPLEGERTEENNVAKTDVQVVEDKIRLLLADYFPRWETRYLLNLFKRDERIAFEQLLFEPGASGSGPAKIPSFPNSLDEWARYRVVVLGDVHPNILSIQQQKQLKEYVTELGGNLIVVAGRDWMPGAFLNQPLAEIIPVEHGGRALSGTEPFYLHVTSEGASTLATQVADLPEVSERVWREMSYRLPIYGLSEFSRPKPTAHSLIAATNSRSARENPGGDARTFLAWQYVGRGRVVYIAAPVTYQLRYGQGDLYHHRFWGQMLRWAVARDLAEGAKTVRLSTDKTRYEHGDPVQVSLRLNQLDGRVVGGADCHITAFQDDKVVQEISLHEEPTRPGSYEGVLERLPAGPIKLRASGQRISALLAAENYRRPVEALLHVDPSGALELRQPLCNIALLREVADAAHGLVVPPTGLPAALRQLDLAPQVEQVVNKKPLWNRWDLFSIFILCLTLEWAGRKYAGMV